MKKTFQLTEVDCGLCAQRIEDAVLRVEGVKAAHVNFATARLTLEANDDAFEAVLGRVKTAVTRADRDCRIV